jgi:hypothetical protein
MPIDPIQRAHHVEYHGECSSKGTGPIVVVRTVVVVVTVVVTTVVVVVGRGVVVTGLNGGSASPILKIFKTLYF